MEKKIITSFTIVCASILLFTTCKKYPEGGLLYQSYKHLFGGNKAGSSKTWKLKLYEVNEIDSTYLIEGANTIPDFYNKFITFNLDEKHRSSQPFTANTFLFNYQGLMISSNDHTIFYIGYKTYNNREDSVQCKTKDMNTYCSRNIFYPEGYFKWNWTIKKLTRKEAVFTSAPSTPYQKNSYKIILTQ